jgi:hypothetical protein
MKAKLNVQYADQKFSMLKGLPAFYELLIPIIGSIILIVLQTKGKTCCQNELD